MVSNNKKASLPILFLAVALIAFHSFAKRHPTAEETNGLFNAFRAPLEWQGKYAPDFELDLLDGNKFRLSEEIGKKVIILNFFATWCGPCLSEMPELERYLTAQSGNPVVLVGIDADESEDAVRKFVKDVGVSFPIGIDHHRKIHKSYGVISFPTTVLIGADGKVHVYQLGEITNAEVAFDAFVRSGVAQIRSSQGISRTAFLDHLKEQDGSKQKTKAPSSTPSLQGRALSIVEQMACPCGCSDLVNNCSCRTAKNIKKQLETMDFNGKSNREIIEGLNREFCVKDGKQTHDHS